jgi:hypothetical protein
MRDMHIVETAEGGESRERRFWRKWANEGKRMIVVQPYSDSMSSMLYVAQKRKSRLRKAEVGEV